MTQLLRDRERFPPAAAPAAEIARSWPWLVAAGLVAALFVGLLGPGILLTPAR